GARRTIIEFRRRGSRLAPSDDATRLTEVADDGLLRNGAPFDTAKRARQGGKRDEASARARGGRAAPGPPPARRLSAARTSPRASHDDDPIRTAAECRHRRDSARWLLRRGQRRRDDLVRHARHRQYLA